jgi:DNA-binding NtrC family response regulator
MTRILVADPTETRRTALAELLERSGFTVNTTTDVTQAITTPQPPDLIVARGDGPLALRACELTTAPLVLITSSGGVRDAVAAIKAGAVQYFVEPVDADELLAAIEAELAAPRTRTAEPGNDPIVGAMIIGSSACMRAVYERIDHVAPNDMSVLIQGEAGTGKALVAHAIHRASGRRHAPLVTLNCAMVPDGLIEAELFGQEFSIGASPMRRPGLIEAARGGTLFLDEIAELAPQAQARLVRVLDAGEFRPVGALRARPVDVRLLAASHRDIARLAAEGEFRNDLFERLKLCTVNLPPLRERAEDIPQLALHLLRRICGRLSRPEPTLAPSAIEAMASYDWPGNVRELENVIERAVILATADELDADMLAILPHAPRPPVADSDATTLEDYFVRFVLDNQDELTETELAAKLGISRKSLWERRQRLNIPRRATLKRGPRRHT